MVRFSSLAVAAAAIDGSSLLQMHTAQVTAQTDIPFKQCRVKGDPHVFTFDGLRQDYFKAGEYWIVNSDMIKIQSTFIHDYGYTQAFTGAVAISGKFIHESVLIIEPNFVRFPDGTTRVGEITLDGSNILQNLNDTVADLETFPGLTLGRQPVAHNDVFSLKHMVDNETELIVKIHRNGYSSDLFIWMRKHEDEDQDGVCGNFNGDKKDDTIAAVSGRQADAVAPMKSLFDVTAAELIGCPLVIHGEQAEGVDTKFDGFFEQKECAQACVDMGKDMFQVNWDGSCHCRDMKEKFEDKKPNKNCRKACAAGYPAEEAQLNCLFSRKFFDSPPSECNLTEIIPLRNKCNAIFGGMHNGTVEDKWNRDYADCVFDACQALKGGADPQTVIDEYADANILSEEQGKSVAEIMKKEKKVNPEIAELRKSNWASFKTEMKELTENHAEFKAKYLDFRLALKSKTTEDLAKAKFEWDLSATKRELTIIDGEINGLICDNLWSRTIKEFLMKKKVRLLRFIRQKA